MKISTDTLCDVNGTPLGTVRHFRVDVLDDAGQVVHHAGVYAETDADRKVSLAHYAQAHIDQHTPPAAEEVAAEDTSLDGPNEREPI